MPAGGTKSLRAKVALYFGAIGVLMVAGVILYIGIVVQNGERENQQASVATSGRGIGRVAPLALGDGNYDYLRQVASGDAGLREFTDEIAIYGFDAQSGVIDVAPKVLCHGGLARRIRKGDDPCATDGAPALSADVVADLYAQFRASADAFEEGRTDMEGADGLTVLAYPVWLQKQEWTEPRLVGLVIASSRQRGFGAILSDHAGLTVVPVAGMIVFLLAIFWVLDRLVVRPIGALAGKARAIAVTGDIGARGIAATGNEATEIANLIDCFNAMTSRVRETNDNLKELVEERTRALADANADLTATLGRAEAYSEELADAKAGLEALNRDLVTAVERAEQASQAKSEFLARMNHEIRNPLNSIIQRAEYLQEIAEEEDLDEFHEETTGIVSKSQHLLGVINQVLDMSKIESGKIEPEILSREIILLVEEVRDMAEPMVTRNRSTLLVETAGEDLGEMRTDVTMLRQCLINLLSNSAKFTSQGEVRLKVEMLDPAGAATRLGRQAQSSPEWVSFTVTDTGIGMTPQELARVFTPFTQANESISAHYGGTGLGLSLTRKFCQALGGDVFMDSEKGVGTTAQILLPRALEGDSPEAIITKIAASTRTKRILVVEDDKAFSERISEVLEPLKADIQQARTVDAGLAICRSLRPDVVLLDIDMPVKNGYDFLEEVRRDEKLADLAVLIVTKTEPNEKTERLGARGFFAKPVSADRMEELTETVRGILADRSPRLVLVVDDEDPIRRTLRRSFESRGSKVVEAENGARALDRLAEGPLPDLVIMDLDMPEMDGFEAIGRMRDTPEWSAIPIVVLTSKDLTRNERRFVLGSTEGLLQKNVVPLGEVVHQVAKLVDARADAK